MASAEVGTVTKTPEQGCCLFLKKHQCLLGSFLLQNAFVPPNGLWTVTVLFHSLTELQCKNAFKASQD